MQLINRRNFLSKLYRLSGSLTALSLPLRNGSLQPGWPSTSSSCWLSVCIPFVIEDPASNLHTDIILTSASFQGIDGHSDGAHSTDYEIYLYDCAGNPQPIDGSKRVKQLNIPAMHTTLIKCSDLIGRQGSFWGGMRIRMWARGKEPTHVSDLFSAAFVRWNFTDSFDTLHAHPDPLQLQSPDKFFSSTPFPNLEEYSCALCLFNPYNVPSIGKIFVYAGDGQRQIEQPYKLAPYGSTIFNLNTGALSTDHRDLFNRAVSLRKEIRRGGSITIENDESTAKNFAYMMIKGKANNAFSAEHTIHQGDYPIKRGSSPFGSGQSFKARGWVYSALIFNDKTLGGLNLSSRVYVSSGRPLEDEMWLLAYVSDSEGDFHWTTMKDDRLPIWLPAGFLSQGAIRLSPFQSCELDFEKLSLTSGFAGGIGVATSPQTSHVLMKVEVRARNWGTSAFSHFRPGSRSARALQDIKGRGGVVSDYIISGARLNRTGSLVEADCLIGIFNMEEDKLGEPVIEAFNSNGFIMRKNLGKVPGLACRHFLLSDVFSEPSFKDVGPLTLRLIDSNAALIMSALHIDYKRRDIAIDHGSDRFSTYIDYGCI